MSKKLSKIAKKVFEPENKEPYYLKEIPIRNLEELKEHLDLLSGKEVDWIASWIEYLGDPKTAERIRGSQTAFKKIILKRYNQLQKYR